MPAASDCQRILLRRWLLVLCCLLSRPDASSAQTTFPASLEVRDVVIVTGRTSTRATSEAANLLKSRLDRRSQVRITITPDASPGAALQILLGCVKGDAGAASLLQKHSARLPGGKDPAPEGFVLKSVVHDGVPTLLAIGADERAMIYVAGEIVRQVRRGPDQLTIRPIDVSTAPAYRFRGFSANQGGSMRRLTGARSWTTPERLEVIGEYALAGGNCFYAGDQGDPVYDFAHSVGMMTEIGVRPNQYRQPHPSEWKAGGLEAWEGKDWICPSVPEARAALLKQWEAEFERRSDHDVMRLYAGDPGGCRDQRCEPWGRTFVHLCEEVAGLWLRKHPHTVVLIANQDLTNAGDQAIFDYLNEKPREWLYGLCYGPGSNAMSPYFRRELREDLFVYPRGGPVNRYLAETLHQLPARQQIVHYSDITHWISAQYAVAKPEPHLARAYGRRALHARPRAFYRIFQTIMPFSEGDIIYSEGYHDEFHQYLWARLLWDPHRELDDVVREYCVLYFGEDAAGPMAQALYELEGQLETPLDTNEGIDRYAALMREAGRRMASHFRKDNHRWLLHMEKALLDQYNQRKLQIELAKEKAVRAQLETALADGRLDAAIEKSLAIFDEPAQTDEMRAWREEAQRLGDESNRLFGVRNIGQPRLDNPLRPLPQLKAQLQSAKNAQSDADKRRLITEAIDMTQKSTDRGHIFW